MRSVHSIAKDIVAREGGFVNDPDDPGGATNFGVTIGTLRRLGLDLNRDGQTTVQDVRLLSADQAIEIFKTHYFTGPGISDLPEALHPTVFDMQVNAGSNAVKLLQRLLVKFGASVTVDGVIGPQTATVTAEIFDVAPHHIVDAYGIERRNYYYAVADARPQSRKFARRRDGGKGGWIVRAEEFIDPKYHFSDAQHAERTKAWA